MKSVNQRLVIGHTAECSNHQNMPDMTYIQEYGKELSSENTVSGVRSFQLGREKTVAYAVTLNELLQQNSYSCVGGV